MHAFTRLPKSARWAGALLLAALLVGVLGACVALITRDWRLLPLLFPLVPVLATLESLLLTPLYTLLGRFHYYSPLLLATRRSDGGLDLHVGTLFDYVMRLRWKDRGPRATRTVTADLLLGLVALCEEVERGTLPQDAPIVATSYFFSDRSLARLGFQVRSAPAFVVQNLVVASLSIALRLSFTRGRPTFPDLRKTRQAVTSAGSLVQHKDMLRQALQRLAPIPAA